MSNQIRAIIVDDESHCRSALLKQLEWSTPQVEVVATCENVEQAITAIKTHQPDLVFLDIEMPGKNGFDLLNFFDPVHFEVIFTTAYDNFALEAFKVHAVDYLLKPIDEDALLEAIKRVTIHIQNKRPIARIQELIQHINLKQGEKRIPFPMAEGVEFINTADIIRCESEGSYARIFYNAPKPLFIAKSLRQIEDLIDSNDFIRVHQSHLVNVRHILRYLKADGGQLVLSDNTHIPISRGKKDDWKDWVKRQ
ncbi:MAG: LytTR family DNA-binding domain-containing protein [Bacteroidota bacterium]